MNVATLVRACAVLILGMWIPQAGLARVEVPYQGCFHAASTLHAVPMDLLLAVARTESNMDPVAVSSANAHGIMQIQWPGTARHLGARRVSELYNPCFNISLGAQYLAELLQLFGGDEVKALAAYNYGPTRIQKSAAIPDGALAYVDRVRRHRHKISGGNEHPGTKSLVSGTAQPQRLLVRFDSRLRARRVVKNLNEHLVNVEAVVKSGNEVHLVGVLPLTLADRLTLEQFGLVE